MKISEQIRSHSFAIPKEEQSDYSHRFSSDSSEETWDKILLQTMPARFVFGIGTDDNHSDTRICAESDLGAAYTTLLLDERAITNQGLLDALKNGHITFSSHREIKGKNDNKPKPPIACPQILSIEIEKHTGTIIVQAKYAKKIEWIHNGKMVKRAYSIVGKFTTKIKVENFEDATLGLG